MLLMLIMLLGLVMIAIPGAAGADSGIQGVAANSLTIKIGYFGGPYYTKKIYTVSDIEALPHVEQAYTYIDNMPSVVIDSGKGVKLADLLTNAGIDVNSIEKFYFYSTDVKHGWYEDLDKSYLLDTDRYYYPDLPSHWDYGTESATAGAVYGAVRVDTIIAYQDNWKRFATAPDFSVHDTSTRFRLLFGQTDTGTRTASRSVMWVREIDAMLGGAPPGGITLDQSLVDVKVGSTFQLMATVTPGDATDKGVVWTSSDTRVATVDNNGRVTVVGPGTASIAASTVVGNLTANCTVNAIDRSSDNQNAATAGAGAQSNGGRRISGGSQASDGGQQYLGSSGVVAAGIASRQSGSQPWRVYEMSAGAVPLQIQQVRGGLDIDVAVLLLALFILGLVRGYMKYVREVDR